MTFIATAQDRVDIPDAAALAEAKKLVDEVYDDLLAVRSDEERAASARVLIMRAEKSDNVPAAKYIMYEAARSLAVEAGDTESAMDAINGLAESFKSDSGGFLNLAAISLQSLSRKARNETQYAAVARAGLSVAERMVRADLQDEAMDLLTQLRSAAMRSRRSELSSTYKQMLSDLRIIQNETERVAADLKAIQQKPDDPALNLSVGKYLTLYRGDWDKGLAMLAKSSDETLAAAAKADLAGARDIKAKIAVGDYWWKIAEGYSKIEAEGLTERARHWYRLALPKSEGIERSLLNKRLEATGQVKWGDLVLEPGIRTWIELDGDAAGAKPWPITKNGRWVVKTKPKGAQKFLKLFFEGYLYFPRTETKSLLAQGDKSSVTLGVNGERVLYGTGSTEARVTLIKGYNLINGYIRVSVNALDDPNRPPFGSISFSDAEGNQIPVPSENWFHDVSK